jgi:GT2 family glycosyltransferase
MKKISVIILNYNGKQHLETYLPSVIKNTPLHIADIVVADNASTDDSVHWLKETYPALKIIQLKSNYGYAEGYLYPRYRIRYHKLDRYGSSCSWPDPAA